MPTPIDLAFNQPIKRRDKGAAVRLVQEWLCLNGIRVDTDKDFGAATEAAVRRFQALKGLSETGIVDETCFNTLVEPMRRALAHIAPGGMSYGQLVVAYARQHLAERPVEVGGQNRGPWVRLYMGGKEGADYPWCAGFACFVLGQAADTLGRKVPIKTGYSCDGLALSAKEKGLFVPGRDLAAGAKPPAGSIFLVKKSKSDWTHTGIATAFMDEAFETIEGNTSSRKGEREGFEVCARIRAFKGKDFIEIV